jgi:hypothetical protein
VSCERDETLHRGEPDEAREETHGLDAFEEVGITFVDPLRHDALEREDAFARQLDDPALRALVFRPRLHVPVTRVVERGVTGVQVEAGLPALEQRVEFARLFARQGVRGHAGSLPPRRLATRDVAHIRRPAGHYLCMTAALFPGYPGKSARTSRPAYRSSSLAEAPEGGSVTMPERAPLTFSITLRYWSARFDQR